MRNGSMPRAAGTSVLVFLMVLMTVVVAMPPRAAADGGDFSLDFIAAEPSSYDHAVGGGAFDDRTIGLDVVESLEGGDFRCFDVVTYLVGIETAVVPTDENQTIELDFTFLADTTGQSGVAHVDVLQVLMNYGPVVAGDGSGGTDLGVQDDGGSAATLVYEGFDGDPFTPGAELEATVRVSDLEAGEKTVLRVDVELGCMPGRPTGNLQAGISAARVTEPASDVISVGQQTIPFKSTSDVVRSTITVIKDADPAIGTFDFTLSGPAQAIGADPFSDTRAVSGALGQYWWPSLVPGEYHLSEFVPAGWTLESISCEGGEWSAGPDAATILLPERQSIDVVCTFSDYQDRGSIEVIKITEPESDEVFQFALVPGDKQDVSGASGSHIWSDLVPGDYSLSEVLTPAQEAAGWVNVSATCTNNDDPGAITLDPGAHVVCTFRNVQALSSITVEKQTDPPDMQGFEFALDDKTVVVPGIGGSHTWTDVEGGQTYRLAESLSVGQVAEQWSLDSVTCTSALGSETVSLADGVDIDLVPGDHVTCTFSNVQARGSITVVKNTNPVDQMAFTFALDTGGKELVAGNGGSHTWEGLAAGRYSLAETLTPSQQAAGWRLESATCSNGDSPVELDLEPGEDVTCTFLNVQETLSITVIKKANQSGSFEFTLLPVSSGAVPVQTGGSHRWTGLIGGETKYTLSEVIPGGWSLIEAACDTEFGWTDNYVEFYLGEADVTCTFTNYKPTNGTTTTTTTQPPALGEIGDFVWEDSDGDGVQGPAEKGVASAQVKLFKGGSLVATTLTDVQGIYNFGGLAAGVYEVQFALPAGFEFTLPNEEDNDAADSDANPLSGKTGGITLAAGEIDHTWDAGVFRPARVLPQVVTTTTTPEVLPFTGSPDTPGLGGLAAALAALGGMAVLAIKRKEEQPVGGWSRRLPEVH